MRGYLKEPRKPKNNQLANYPSWLVNIQFGNKEKPPTKTEIVKKTTHGEAKK